MVTIDNRYEGAYVVRNGAWYYLFASEANCCAGPTTGYTVWLETDGLALVGQPRRLGVRNDAEWEGALIEAPTLWRDGDTYYLFYSANDYASSLYAVGYATADKVLGPYTDGPGNPILATGTGAANGPGGQAIVRGPGGGLWFAYHAWGELVGDDAGGQRAMWLDRLRFVDGKPRGRRTDRRAPGGAVSRGTGHPAIVLAAAVLALLAVRAAAPFLAPPPAPAVVARTAASAPAPAPPRAAVARLDEPTATRLLLSGDGGLLRVDVDAHTVHPIPLLGRPEADQGLVQRDGTVVAVHGGIAYAASGSPGRPATRLGPASYAFASADPRRVWLVDQTGDPDRWFRVREVAVPGPGPARPGPPTGRVLARGVPPLGHRPMAGVPGGLLVGVAGPGGGLAVWDPRTGRARPGLAAGSPVVVATRGRLVAWVEGPTLHLADLATGRDRVVPAPSGSDGFAPAGAFSPDGRVLSTVTRAGFSARPALALVAVDRAAAVPVAGSEGALADRCSPCLAWAPAGDWVFFNRLGPGFNIGAYRLHRPRAAIVPLQVPGSLPPSFVAF